MESFPFRFAMSTARLLFGAIMMMTHHREFAAAADKPAQYQEPLPAIVIVQSHLRA